jgi:chromosome segregation ATPase
VAQGAEPRWWRRGRDKAQAAARASAATAATSFVELDTLQRRVTLQVEAYAALDRGPTGDQLAGGWAAVRRQADEAAAAYLRVPEQFDVETDLSERDAGRADAEYRHAAGVLRQAVGSIQTFAGHYAGQFATVESALARLSAAGRDADAAIATVRDAIARAEAAGTRAYEAAEALRRAEEARAVLARGAAVNGLGAAVAAADLVLAETARARELVDTLPAQRDEVRRSLTAARTRMDAVTNRRERLAETFSALRREFLASSYADIEKSPADADRELGVARDRLAFAARHADQQQWSRARTAIAEARHALDRAAGAVDLVTQRLTALHELARDPQEPVRRTRFAVREAQKLFVFMGTRADPWFAGQLDALVRRVDAAEQALAAPRADYWRLDRDLARIRDETAEVVRRLRGG